MRKLKRLIKLMRLNFIHRSIILFLLTINLLNSNLLFSQDSIYIHYVHEAIRSGNVFIGSSIKTLDYELGSINKSTFSVKFFPMFRVGVFVSDKNALAGLLSISTYKDRDNNNTNLYLIGGSARHYINDDSPNLFIDLDYVTGSARYNFSTKNEIIEKQQHFDLGLGYAYFNSNVMLEGSINFDYYKHYSFNLYKYYNSQIDYEKTENQSFIHLRLGIHFYL